MIGHEARNTLLLQHYALARGIARRLYPRLPRTLDLDDLTSVAVLGLVDAIDRYDDGRGVPFEAYARLRIRGAVLDAVRRAEWTPRSVRRRSQRLQDGRRALLDQLGRDPTRTEMADHLGTSPAGLDRLRRNAEVRRVVSLDERPRGGDPLRDRLAGERDLEAELQHEELRSMVLEAYESLPSREREAITLHYFREMRLREIGDLMGVTESRVCQLCKQGIRRMRKRLPS